MSRISLAPIREFLRKRRVNDLAKRLEKRARENSDGDVLSREEKEEAILFYKKTTGQTISTAYHNYLKEKSGAYYKEYIPENLFYSYIDPYFNNVREARFLDNKCYYDFLFAGLAMPKTYLKRMNGMWFSAEGRVIGKEAVDGVLRGLPSLFIKAATNSYGGKGVYYLSAESDDVVSRFWDITAGIKVDIVVQEALTQHPALARINESSVNTIRVLSMLKPDGSIKAYSIILRMGIAGAKVDNASSGGITCGIDAGGHGSEAGYYSYVNAGKRLPAHPTSGIPFREIVIPDIGKVLDFVQKAALRIPHFRLVSWDIALREDGEPVLIEANFYDGEIDFHQLNNGPLFKEDTEAILREVFHK